MKKFGMLKLLAILAIASVFTGCGCGDEKKYYFPQEFKTFNVFPENSWWIYSINRLTFDTIIVKNCTIEPPDETYGNDCNSYENFSSIYFSSGYGTFKLFGLFLFCTDSLRNYFECYTTSPNNWFRSEDVLLQMYDTREYAPVFYFGNGVYLSDSGKHISIECQTENGSGYWLENEYDTVYNGKNVLIKTYRSFDFENLDPSIQNHINILPPFRVYYASGIGLIRKEMYNGDIWELENYFINH